MLRQGCARTSDFQWSDRLIVFPHFKLLEQHAVSVSSQILQVDCGFLGFFGFLIGNQDLYFFEALLNPWEQ